MSDTEKPEGQKTEEQKKAEMEKAMAECDKRPDVQQLYAENRVLDRIGNSFLLDGPRDPLDMD